MFLKNLAMEDSLLLRAVLCSITCCDYSLVCVCSVLQLPKTTRQLNKVYNIVQMSCKDKVNYKGTFCFLHTEQVVSVVQTGSDS